VLFESVRLGLYDELVKAALPACKIASRLSLSANALERLLRVLLEMGVLEKKKNLYRNSAISKKYLCKVRPLYIGDFFIHRQSLQRPWADLKYSLKRNGMVRPDAKRLSDYPRQLKKFMGAMDALGRIKAEILKEELDFSQYSSMLDLGGGIGTYAVSFARDYPRLRGVVFDLLDVSRLARLHIKKNGLDSRVKVIAGQCLADDLPLGQFDLIFISNLLHIYNETDCKRIIKKASGVLAKGGSLVVHDYIFGVGDSVSVSLFDMTMLIGTPQGRCYEQKDIAKWLRAAGIRKIQSAEILAGTSILWGLKV
jgi:predicted O-methyltransferase YrrM